MGGLYIDVAYDDGVEATLDIALAELQSELQRRCGVRAGLWTIHNALRRIGVRQKKSP